MSTISSNIRPVYQTKQTVEEVLKELDELIKELDNKSFFRKLDEKRKAEEAERKELVELLSMAVEDLRSLYTSIDYELSSGSLQQFAYAVQRAKTLGIGFPRGKQDCFNINRIKQLALKHGFLGVKDVD